MLNSNSSAGTSANSDTQPIVPTSSPNIAKHNVSCRLIGGFQDTRNNKEDFALTPYLFGVWVSGSVIKVYGIGICWGFYSVYLGLGFNVPSNYPSFKILSENGS